MKRFWIFSLVIGIAIHTLEVDAQDAASWVRKLYAPQADTVSLIFLGDIMVHGMQLTSAKNEKGYSFLHCYEPIAPRLIKADLSIANIETAFAGPPYTGYPLFSTPEILVSELKESGIGLLLTANNHLCDQGEKGLRRSLHLFDSIGISHTGVFRSPQERDQRYPLLIGIKGIRIAFLAYSYGTNGFTVPKPYVVNLIDTAIISKDINKAKRLSPDFIIACMHWGEEYQIEPNARQKELAKFLHDSGVDIIIGAHPHVPQAMEVSYHPTGEIKNVTAFSLGNVISNQPFPNTQIGLLVNIKLVKSGFYKEIAAFDWEWIATDVRIENGHRKYYTLPIDQCQTNSLSIKILQDGTVRPSLYFKTDSLSKHKIKYTLRRY